ncbi:7-cyano-7-deazaguanine synthase [Stratiformator vulcanicus]|uniref:7-cyano-7-deazaguanine synthase n=2 Tax=Stratiformator vulcanicus TaxID=2527980 RepID=A0A517QWV1_9PLAN|nr:7-cyano-7-deazaguanine synthase QueC [Stratiformator vulcanicus]QDT36139.1 7-cyano-7-deazaguanine synthase [Stratiformator vulcanicus]
MSMADEKFEPGSMNGHRAVVLVSGGLDSATVLAMAKQAGFDVFALSFDYGQRHRFELEAAEKVCRSMGASRHVTLSLDLRAFGGSALTADIDVPKDRADDEMEAGIPITYVPARNTVFLSLALGWAESLDASDIFIGVNAVDYSGYPDCRTEFIQAFEQTANLATKSGVEGSAHWNIHTPLIELTKAEIIREGVALGVDFSLTHSCYDPDKTGRACGHCDSCILRRRGFESAGVPDPTPYVD